MFVLVPRAKLKAMVAKGMEMHREMQQEAAFTAQAAAVTAEQLQ